MASKRFRDAVGIDPDRVVSAAVDAALGETRSNPKKHHPGRVLVAGAAIAAAAAVGQKRMPRMAKVPLRMGLHKLSDMTHLDDLADAVRDRLVGHEPDEPDEDEYYDDDDLDDDDYADEEEFDDEPRDEAEDQPDDEGEDEDFDDEEDDDGFDDEPEDGDGPRGEGDEADDDEFEEDEPEEDLEGESDEEEPDDEEPEAEEDDDEIAARSVDLGIAPEDRRRRSRERAPDLFAALRTPARQPRVMRRGSHRVDPAARPPEPDESRTGDKRRGRANNPKSKAARK